MTTQSLTTKLPTAFRNCLPLFSFLIAFGVIGSIILLSSHAATTTASVEAENGTISGAASSVADSGASAGHAVKFGTSRSSSGARGWAHIANNTLVSDQGTLLRGATLWFVPEAAGQFRWATSTSPWPYFGQYHLNTVRLAVEYGPANVCGSPLSLADAETDMDAAIAQATAHHMYAIVDLHCTSGGHDQASAVTFWQTIAARYKNDTNVIYELLNEPVAWNPTNYTTQDLNDEEQLYSIVRTAAPQTPIIMMSFAIPENSNSNPSPTMTDVANRLTGINWSNTLVGFHGYWVNNDNGEKQLKQSFPLINTEMHEPLSGTSGEYQTVNGSSYYAQVYGGDQISWVCWNCNDTQSDTSVLSALQTDATNKGYWWAADQ